MNSPIRIYKGIAVTFLTLALAPSALAVWNHSMPVEGAQQVTQGATVTLVLTNGDSFTGTVNEVEEDDDRKVAYLSFPGNRPPGSIDVASITFSAAPAATAMGGDTGQDNWKFSIGIGGNYNQTDAFLRDTQRNESELANTVLPGLGVSNITTSSSADDSGTGFTADASVFRRVNNSGSIYLKFTYMDWGKYGGQVMGNGTAGASQVDVIGTGWSEMTSTQFSLGYEYEFTDRWSGYLGLGTMQLDRDDSSQSSLSADGTVIQTDTSSSSDDVNAEFVEFGIRFGRYLTESTGIEIDIGASKTNDLFNDVDGFIIGTGIRVTF